MISPAPKFTDVIIDGINLTATRQLGPTWVIHTKGDGAIGRIATVFYYNDSPPEIYWDDRQISFEFLTEIVALTNTIIAIENHRADK